MVPNLPTSICYRKREEKIEQIGAVKITRMAEESRKGRAPNAI